ncbi:MAG: hypothetical protein EAZ99_09570 [Alphaproteobacteria bacterium]|nr:hypothetical protein [Alphaproteobacteria bacterium]TAD89627.1 MAG: hypothetical protein EAZ99_09570 [Alphaproteobacteria bacterium]
MLTIHTLDAETVAVFGPVFVGVTAHLLATDLVAACRSRRDLRLDLARTRLLDTAGVGAIALVAKTILAAGGRLTLSGLAGQPALLVRRIGLNHTLPCQFADQDREVA